MWRSTIARNYIVRNINVGIDALHGSGLEFAAGGADNPDLSSGGEVPGLLHFRSRSSTMSEFPNPNFSLDLSGDVALVTGATSGLGWRFAEDWNPKCQRLPTSL